MERKQRIVDSLTSMGFELKEQEGFGYLFSFGHFQLVYMLSEANDQMIRIVVPNLCEVSDDNELAVYEAMNEIAQTVNYVKPMMVESSVWISYEHRQVEDCDIDKVLEFMIRTLLTAATLFHRKIYYRLSKDEEQTKYKLIWKLLNSPYNS